MARFAPSFIILLLAGCAFATTLEEEQKQEELLSGIVKPMSSDWLGQVKFYLYTRSSSDMPELMDFIAMERDGTLPKTFNPKHPVKVGIHGWRSNGNQMQSVLEEYLEHADYNAILMDWAGADSILYPVARAKVPLLGAWLAKCLDVLAEAYDLKLEDMHLIGHSLGAHVAGMAGRLVDRGMIGRITGLDPAKPLFYGTSDQLSHSAALFVDGIHTCGKQAGVWAPFGHVDFYPNGGGCNQPGCSIFNIICAHSRAYDLFEESIDKNFKFWSEPFGFDGPDGDFDTNFNEALMGEHVDPRTRGVYYLETASRKPFSIPDYDIKRIFLQHGNSLGQGSEINKERKNSTLYNE